MAKRKKNKEVELRPDSGSVEGDAHMEVVEAAPPRSDVPSEGSTRFATGIPPRVRWVLGLLVVAAVVATVALGMRPVAKAYVFGGDFATGGSWRLEATTRFRKGAKKSPLRLWHLWMGATTELSRADLIDLDLVALDRPIPILEETLAAFAGVDWRQPVTASRFGELLRFRLPGLPGHAGEGDVFGVLHVESYVALGIDRESTDSGGFAYRIDFPLPEWTFERVAIANDAPPPFLSE